MQVGPGDARSVLGRTSSGLSTTIASRDRTGRRTNRIDLLLSGIGCRSNGFHPTTRDGLSHPPLAATERSHSTPTVRRLLAAPQEEIDVVERDEHEPPGVTGVMHAPHAGTDQCDGDSDPEGNDRECHQVDEERNRRIEEREVVITGIGLRSEELEEGLAEC